LAYFYRAFAKKFKVFMFSRKDILTEGYTTEDMAKDLKVAFDYLGIDRAYVLGVSQGGMIAQRFAIDYPNAVEKLIIAVSASKANDLIRNAIKKWVELAKQSDYKSLIIDTLEKTYSQQKLKTYRLAYPIISRIGKPTDFCRFLIQANACLTHNAYDELQNIVCPTLIIGGDDDKIVGVDASLEMAQKIKNSELHIYNGLGHGAYEESKDFNQRVINFLQTSK
jgi:pimeloyl-ACP methyl ester carboxylesterase